MTEPEVWSYRLAEAERDIASLRVELGKMRAEAEARERARLKAGIGALGSAVLALVSVLWAYRAAIFK